MASPLREIAATLRGLFDPGDWIGMKPQLDPSATLLALDHTPNPFEVKVQIWLGLVVTTVVAIIVALLDDGFAIFVACGFGFIGLLNLIYGVIRSRFEKSMLFTGDQVIVKTRGLFGRKDWSEPIAGYRGVLLREIFSSTQGVGGVPTTKTYHVIELAHSTIHKVLPLYVKEGGEPPRDVQEAFCRRFNLPALAPDGDDVALRTVDALDAPIVRHASLDPGPPPSGVTLRKRGDAVHITVGQGRLGAVLVWVVWSSLPLVLGGIAYIIEPSVALPAAGMGALFVLMMLGFGVLVGGNAKKRQPALVIEPDRVWIDRPVQDDRLSRLARRIVSAVSGRDLRTSERPPEMLPREAIEQIRVDTYTSHHGGSSHGSSGGNAASLDRLVIEGDRGRLTFLGTQHDRKKLEWVRDHLRHELAGGAHMQTRHPSNSQMGQVNDDGFPWQPS